MVQQFEDPNTRALWWLSRPPRPRSDNELQQFHRLSLSLDYLLCWPKKTVVIGCVSRGMNHATFDHVFGQQSISSFRICGLRMTELPTS